ncbi:acyltransferase family protein [Methylobacterium sp. CM6257]
MPRAEIQSGRRLDIDGLRAVAVGAVLVFHFFPEILHGGYIGVDVFFVISGYVVSLSIRKDLSCGMFSLSTFYAARIRRLFPSLLVVTALSLIVGWFIYFQNEFLELGRDTLYSLVYVVNFKFARGAGYFDTSMIPSPLLHIWSLAVEEQFYAIWPLVLTFILTPAIRPRAKLIVACVGLASMVLNLALVERHPLLAFYLLPMRAWEFVLGALLALSRTAIERNAVRAQNLLSVLGFCLLTAAAILLDEHSTFPGWLALFPTFGTILVICTPGSVLNRCVLSSPTFLWIGQRSYPLYLWHWPLLIFPRVAIGEDLSVELRIFLLLLSIVAANFSYNYIEWPYRSLFGAESKAAALKLLLYSGACAFAAALIAMNVIPERLNEYRPFLEARNDWQNIATVVTLPGKSTDRVLFFGDSFVRQYFPRADFIARNHENRRTIQFVTRGGCAPVPNINRRSDRDCAYFSKLGFEIAHSEAVKTVIIGGAWRGFVNRGDYFDQSTGRPLNLLGDDLHQVLADLCGEISKLVASGKQVFLILNPPGGPTADPVWLIRTNSATKDAGIAVSDHTRRVGYINEAIAKVGQEGGAFIIDPSQWLCNREICKVLDSGGNAIYMDQTHLRASFVRQKLTYLDDIMRN